MELNLTPPGDGVIDLLSLGEVMVRLSPPGHGRIEHANQLEVHVGGGEYNVAYALARLGLKTAFASRLCDNPLGRLVVNHGRAVGVDMSPVAMAPFDGVGKQDRVGLNFTEVGTGVRASVTMYDRGHSAAAAMKPGDVDFDALFADGRVRWLHTGGIFTALSDTSAATCQAALEAAKRNGTFVSYDLNFRSKLWTSEQAQAATKPLLPLIDCLIGNEEDFQKVLGYEVAGVDVEGSGALSTAAYREMVTRVAGEHPHLKLVGTTLREVTSGLINNWSAILYAAGNFYESRRYERLEITDRVGGGDGFVSGLCLGALTGEDAQTCVDLGAAHGALVQTTRGDTSQVTRDELVHVAQGGSARIKR